MFAKTEKIFHILFHRVFRGDYVFKILTFRQLSFLSAFVCAVMLFGALFNMLAPAAEANAHPSVRVPIVMYHQICENSSLWGDYVIPLSELEQDFRFFKDNGITPVSFSQLRKFTENGTVLPSKPIIITFDDGQKSFLTQVVPLLEEYKYPANINIVSSLNEFYTENGDNNDCYAYLNTEDIKTLKKHPLVEIGCHSHNLHSLSTRRGAGKLQGESEAEYKRIILDDLKHFDAFYFNAVQDKTDIYAYPYGIRNDPLLQTLKEQGFCITLTCRESVNVLKEGSDLYELGRFNRPYSINRESFFNSMF